MLFRRLFYSSARSLNRASIVMTDAELLKHWTLPDVKPGDTVVTRFPPEASGYLHIGHVKAALANNSIARAYGGKMILRFDDTNPDKENVEFEHEIIKDLETLKIRPDIGPTFTSDYFEQMLKYARQLLDQGDAYVDESSPEELKKAKFDGYATPSRANTIEKNISLWEELVGGREGIVLRAKISVDDANKALRDPVLYRVKKTPHPRHGDKYVAYPTYDFACPIVDSVEGVTHALRTSEYNDRNAQYEWICNALKIRVPKVLDFSRLNLKYTVMSKRQLTVLVREGIVDGWSDPRMPTLRGILRRGLHLDALRAYISDIGLSRSTNLGSWNSLWHVNRTVIDPIAPRLAAVSTKAGAIKVRFDELLPAVESLDDSGFVFHTSDGEGECCGIKGLTESSIVGISYTIPSHPKNPDLGRRTVYRTREVLLDRADVKLLGETEEVTIIGWGNVQISNVDMSAGTAVGKLNLTGSVKSTKYKIHAVPVMGPLLGGSVKVAAGPKTGGGVEPPKAEDTLEVELAEYDHVINEEQPPRGEDQRDIKDVVNNFSKVTDIVVLEPSARTTVKGGVHVQLERRGYAILDEEGSKGGEMKMIEVPQSVEKVCHLSARARLIDEVGKAAEPVGMGLMDAAKADAAAQRAGKGKGGKGGEKGGEKGDAAAAKGGAKGGDAKKGGEKGGGGGKAKPAAAAESSDPHSMVLFRVGEIVSVEPHPDESVTALWALKINVHPSEAEPRSICAGLRAHVSAEDLKGRRVVVAANLPPRTLRGVPSNGMVLCACRPKDGAAADADGKVPEEVLPIAPPEGAPVGSRVVKANHTYEGDAPETLSKKQFSRHYEAVAPLLKTNADGVCMVDDTEFVVEGHGPAKGLANAVVR